MANYHEMQPSSNVPRKRLGYWMIIPALFFISGVTLTILVVFYNRDSDAYDTSMNNVKRTANAVTIHSEMNRYENNYQCYGTWSIIVRAFPNNGNNITYTGIFFIKHSEIPIINFVDVYWVSDEPIGVPENHFTFDRPSWKYFGVYVAFIVIFAVFSGLFLMVIILKLAK